MVLVELIAEMLEHGCVCVPHHRLLWARLRPVVLLCIAVEIAFSARHVFFRLLGSQLLGDCGGRVLPFQEAVEDEHSDDERWER